MKSRLQMRVAGIAALGLLLFAAAPGHAQDAGNVRVVRLSRAEGQVLVSHAGRSTWEAASVNLPLQEGDTLATQAGFAEIEFENGATGYLAENSVLQITQLGFSGGGRATELGLTQGTGTFYANLTSQDSFRVQALTFNVAIPERAEFRLDGFRDGASIQVFLGEVSVSTTRGSTNLEKGQSVAVHENDLKDFSIGSLPAAEDAFDQWVTREGEMIRAGNKNTLSYMNSPNYYGLSDLSRYGTWVNVAGFGFSWRPFSVGFTWTPYFNGRWILNPLLGWIWVSDEPWGWMPYHFGSWLLSPTLGWLWVPGGSAGLRQWEPSRVNWVRVGGQVGWVAMSPNDRNDAPANAVRGVITKPSQSPRTGIETNEILTGKALQNFTPVKQPPAEFISHLTQGAHPTSSVNPSIVFEPGTRTYINREAQNEPDRNRPGNGITSPVGPAALMPRYNSSEVQPAGGVPAPAARTDVPRVTLPSRGPTDSRNNRVLLPPPYPAPPASHGNIPSNGLSPARSPTSAPTSAPFNTQARPVALPAPISQPVSQSPPPHTEPAHASPAVHPAAQTPPSDSSPAPANRH